MPALVLLVAAAFASPWSSDPEDLNPRFRARLDRVLGALRAEGYQPSLSCTWRSPELQDLLAGTGRATQAAGGQSCHNRTDADGRPAATAADVWARPLDLLLMLGAPARLASEVAFLRRLGVHARAEGLRWGGDWHGRDSVWSAWGLGWDPAHVEMGPCVSD
jgi:hypothetical protein